MSALEQQVADYLAVRRAMGYKLERAEKLLGQFVAYLDEAGQPTITTELALAWATLPARGEGRWWSYRLSTVRGFAQHLHTIDAACEVPPAELLAQRPRRSVPYLYSDADIEALLAATAALGSAHRAATLHTLIALLSVTGMRVGEAIRLDRSDLDCDHGLLTVRDSKFGKSRQLPLHPTATRALGTYLLRGDRPRPAQPTAAMFVSAAGTRLIYCNVQNTFSRLVAHAGLTPRSAACRPRIHDLRHSFAVAAIIDAYRTDTDVQARLPLLSTYLGHVHPGSTYWYLQAAPELLALAAGRLERHVEGGRR